jgi:L-alanine-DL-glutamate epimerase-like enolase superfamily enzyme
MDALFDERDRFRREQVGLFNTVADSARGQPALLAARVYAGNGMYGLGCVTLGNEATASVIERVLAPLVVGHSPFDVEYLWEKMFRATVNIGRRGLVLHAISAVDIALWDLMGKLLGQPCYNLLGGRTRDAIRAYCSAAYAMEDFDELAAIIRRQMARGYTAIKMRFGWGPLDGREGLRRNVAMVRRVRETVGDGVDLMADAYMGWDVAYALEILPHLDEYGLKWIEEPLMPDDIEGYARLRSRSRIAIACGEHEATRWGFRRLIEAGAADYLQPDVNRVGGVTEARKIWALAQAHDLQVIPHSGDYHNLHMVMSHMNSPLAEHFPEDYLDADTFLAHVLTGQPELHNGLLRLSDRPGFGVELRSEFTTDART